MLVRTFSPILRTGLLLLLSVTCASPPALAAPAGELDASFGDHGRLRLPLADGVFGPAIIEQPADGKWLLPGHRQRLAGGSTFALLRLLPDGSVDDAFGTDGVSRVDFGDVDADASTLVMQPDGKIILAGNVKRGDADADIALARLNPDGSPDPTFGNNGLVTLDLGGFESAANVLLLQNGAIVVAGMTDAGGEADAVFARFLGNGSPDPAFGTGAVAGTTVIGVSGQVDHISAMAMQPDGRLTACGTTDVLDNGIDYSGDMLAARVNANGSVDTTFGNSGVLTVDGSSQHAIANACVALADGSVVLGGYLGAPGVADPALVRFMPDGALDARFGSSGIMRFSLEHLASIQSIVVLADGGLAVAGELNPLHNTDAHLDLFVARVDAIGGALDSSFGNQGVTIIDFGKEGEDSYVPFTRLIATADAKLIAAGQAPGAVLLARVDPAGAGSPGIAGVLTTVDTPSEAEGSAVVTVRRTGGSKGALSVDYRTSAGSATSPADYSDVSGTLTWQDGDVEPKLITIPITADGSPEAVEDFSLVLSNSTAGLAASKVIISIADGGSTSPNPAPRAGGGGSLTPTTLLALALLWLTSAPRFRAYDRHGRGCHSRIARTAK